MRSNKSEGNGAEHRQSDSGGNHESAVDASSEGANRDDKKYCAHAAGDEKQPGEKMVDVVAGDVEIRIRGHRQHYSNDNEGHDKRCNDELGAPVIHGRRNYRAPPVLVTFDLSV